MRGRGSGLPGLRASAPRGPGLTVRAHVPAQVAAVLEDLAAGAALVHPPVLPQLPDQLPPDAVAGRENQAPLEGDAAARVMGEPAQGDKQAVRRWELAPWGKSSRLQSPWKESFRIIPARWEKGGDKLGHYPASGAPR